MFQNCFCCSRWVTLCLKMLAFFNLCFLAHVLFSYVSSVLLSSAFASKMEGDGCPGFIGVHFVASELRGSLSEVCVTFQCSSADGGPSWEKGNEDGGYRACVDRSHLCFWYQKRSGCHGYWPPLLPLVFSGASGLEQDSVFLSC